MLIRISILPGTFLLPGADCVPQIRFKTAAAILAVVKRLVIYNLPQIPDLAVRELLLAVLLHLPALIVLAGSKCRGMLLLAADILILKELKGLLYIIEEKLSA